MTELQIAHIIMAGMGLLFLVITIFSGDFELDLDSPDIEIDQMHTAADSPSIFSLRVLATFLLAFGMAGLICISNGIGLSGQIMSGLGAGLVMAALYFIVMKLMYKMQGDSSVSSYSVIGKVGVVTTPTTESGLLQVKVDNIEYMAREADKGILEKNELIKVVSSSGGSLIVTKYTTSI